MAYPFGASVSFPAQTPTMPPFQAAAVPESAFVPPVPQQAVPAAPAAPVAPPVAAAAPRPPSRLPAAPAPAQPSRPAFLDAILPLVAAFATGSRSPRAIASSLAGYERGRRLRQSELDDIDTKSKRERTEQAEFMSRALAEGAQIDDPVVFEQWKDAIGPMAELHGIPTDVFQFSERAGTAKRRKDVAEAIDTIVKIHGPEILNEPKKAIRLPDGSTMAIGEALRIAGAALNEDGTLAPVRVPSAERKPSYTTVPKGADVLDDLTGQWLPRPGGPAPDEFADLPTVLDQRVMILNGILRQAKASGDREKAAKVQGLIQDAIDAKGSVGRADDRPITLSMGGIPPVAERRVNQIADSFKNEQTVKETVLMADAVRFVSGHMSDETTSAADDQALVYAFAKAMDPGSVVREGEYATVQKYAQSWLSSFGFNAQRVVDLTQFLTPAARRQLKATIRAKFSGRLPQYNNLRSEYGRQISEASGGAYGAERLIQYSNAFPTASAPTGSGGGGDVSSAYADYLRQQSGGR